MARRPRHRTRPARAPAPAPAPEPTLWTSRRLALAVAGLLALHAALAVSSLVRENPTVDEVAHLPAGVTYWQRGTFRLYPHNPPLIKLVAALPVVASGPAMGPPGGPGAIYRSGAWTNVPPAEGLFANLFAVFNADRYFALFTRSRLVMPLFSILGGLVVFTWSRRLYGPWGGLLSLALWCFCPNVLAHARLVTTDVGALSLGLAATFAFWRYLRRPTWGRAALAGVVLGLAQLAKFSNLLLYGLWPLIGLVHVALAWERPGLRRRLAVAVGQGGTIIALSVLVIDAGYGFEGIGRPLGDYEFACATLTRPVERGDNHPFSRNPIQMIAWRHRVNLFRGTPLGRLPAPLPEPYLEGFDLQKIESEGIPKLWIWQDQKNPVGPRPDPDATTGYPVYLDGQLRRSGWWYYYLATLAYKVPEGTWVLVLTSLAVLALSRRSRADWADELTLLIPPTAVLGVMSLATDINLGLRYVLPAFPYAFIAAGKLAPWAEGLRARLRPFAVGGIGACLAATVTATAMIHPHYLAYFNWASGGPRHGSEHLIDSNLDWGQDLVGLADWVREHAPGERVGLAYFGQIHPNLLGERGFAWFLPPTLPGTTRPLVPLDTWNPARQGPRPEGPARRLEPGLYAVSATLLRGLPWKLYDPVAANPGPLWQTERNGSDGLDAFGYFRDLEPIDAVGHSIFLYRVTPADVARLSRRWPGLGGEGAVGATHLRRVRDASTIERSPARAGHATGRSAAVGRQRRQGDSDG